jgi:hypothetical protein
MTAHSVTLQLSETLYDRLRRRAKDSHRSLVDEILVAVESAVPEEEEWLPPEWDRALSDLEKMRDDELWEAARERLPITDSERLESLHLKQRDEGLTASEKVALRELLDRSELTMLVRAHSAKLLKRRGYDISELLTSP